jgi:MFS family permease
MTLFSLLLLLATVLSSGVVLFLYPGGKLDKKTGRYAAILAAIGAVAGVIGWLLLQHAEIPLFYVFLLCLLLFLVVGGFHTVTLYDLFWATRDPDSWKKDSLAKETGFTVALAAVMVLVFVLVFGYLTQNWQVAASMWALLLAFPLPFIFLKSFDLLLQVPRPEFDKKWFYEIFPFDETQWKRENLVSVGFEVADSVANENKWFGTKARFSIVIPRDQELRLIYRLALREYHQRNPSVPVQELGYEHTPPTFWWLFKIPFVLWKPSTWRRLPRYLDPYETIANNHLRNGDFIAVKRMPTG